MYGSAGQAAECGSGPPSQGRVDEQMGVCPSSGRVEPGRSRTPAIIRGQQQAERHSWPLVQKCLVARTRLQVEEPGNKGLLVFDSICGTFAPKV